MKTVRELKDLQKQKYKEMLNFRIPEIVKNGSCISDDGIFELSCQLFPIDYSNPISSEGTDFYPIRALCYVANKITGEEASFSADLLNVPVFHELGFKIQGNYMQMLDKYERAQGWSFSVDYKKMKEPPVITAVALGAYGKTFTFYYDKQKIPYVLFKRRDRATKRRLESKVPVSVFFRAITSMTNHDLLEKFGRSNPFVVSAFSGENELTTADCIEKVAIAMFGETRASELSTVRLKLREIRNNLFRKEYMNLGVANAKRFENSQSFKRRAVGQLLASSVRVADKVYSAGTIITTEIAEMLDASPIDELKIKVDEKVFVLKKFSSLTFRCLGAVLDKPIPELGLKKGTVLGLQELAKLNESDREEIFVRWNKNMTSSVQVTRRCLAECLTKEDLFTAFSIWADNLNGLNVFDKPYELSNRVSIPYDDRICNLITNRMDEISSGIISLLKKFGKETTLLAALSSLKLEDRRNDFIDEIRKTDTKEGQMSEMCNIISYISKSNKLVTDINGNNASPEMRGVQSTQEGRLDPYDTPESGQIGLVHHKTMFADTNENGQLVSPYLVVENGTVKSEDPVYLTALEESGKRIAMWNETFKEEDGSFKKVVNVRVDGNPITVPLEQVDYKEYSPLQTMSVAHGLITLANHSNGKRVVMGCNQQAQALPCVGIPDRPMLGTGVESLMDFGRYCVKDVLRNYVAEQLQMFPELEDSKERLSNSSVKLSSIETIGDSREIEYTVLEAVAIRNERDLSGIDTKVRLTIPYNLKNAHNALFSFRLNHTPDGVYGPDDILAYSLGYSLEKKERVDLVDYGAYKVKEGTFDRGLALGHNLLCGYKTFMSSTIEDSLTINDRLLYDDELTNIRICLIKEELRDNDDYFEQFGVMGNYPDYFMFNGLPKDGTKLKPGDPVIAKVKKPRSNNSKMKTKNVFKYLNYTQEGTVIRSDIVRKNNKHEALVLIALRAGIENGDKMAGRHGNKGVVARIVPSSQMPFDPELGRPLDVCLNPLGVPSRQNVSQLLEGAIAMCRLIDGKNTNISPYHPDALKFIKQQVEEFNVHPRKLIDGRTGKFFKRPINVIVLYMFKLQQVATAGLHSIGLDAPVDPTLLQPRHGSKNEGGQSFGEMENWCLHGVGANNLLNDFYGLQSDNVDARNAYKKNVLTQMDDYEGKNENHNDTMMKSLLRTLGSEVISDAENNTYTMVPLTDSIIRSFSPTPIESAEGLHNPVIFGNTESLSGRMWAKQKWGWIDLGVEIIHPTWIEQGTFSSLINLSFTTDETKKAVWHNLSKELANGVIAGKIFVAPSQYNGVFLAYAANFAGEYNLTKVNDSMKKTLRTGMSALVWMLRSLNVQEALDKIRNKLSSKGSVETNSDFALAEEAARLADFLSAGNTVEDFIVRSFPVVPQSYRVKIESSTLANTVPDFDHYYIQILSAVRKVKDVASVENVSLLYEKLKDIIGYRKNDGRYKNFLTMFCGRDDENNHGKIRTGAQSKRIFCSGRAVITPADYRIRPNELGIPIIMLVKMYSVQLTAWFAERTATGRTPIGFIDSKNWENLFLALAREDFEDFVTIYTDGETRFAEFFSEKTKVAFEKMTQWIYDYFELPTHKRPDGSDRPIIISGRQPSLHKYSTRAFYPVVLKTRAIEINTLLCAGYNADFDGDKMWITAALTKASREEAMRTLGAGVDFINPKNNSIMLEHTQDIVLGCYVATMLENNAEVTNQTLKDVHYYNSLLNLESDVFDGLVEPWDLVHFTDEIDDVRRHYLSTAGRILFNSCLNDGFTDKPFSNPLNIAGVKTERFCDLKYDGIIGKGSGSSGSLTYYNLSDICMDCYNNDRKENGRNEGEDCLEQFYQIELFGFRFSDLFGVTISIDDLDLKSDREAILKEAADLKQQIEQDYADGLISKEDRRNTILSLYTDDEKGTNAKIMNNLINNLPRNNNLFIMMDSGARGNKTQIMHMCGSIGVLSKTKSSTMDDPIVSNYYEGLSDFEVHMASYSSRVGVSSTQMDTKNAGYATRKVVYMVDGTKIVKSDCGKTNWWFDCEWEDIRSELSRFYPSKEWIERVGNIISADGEVKTIDEIMKDGFNTLETSKGEFKAEPYLLKGSRLIEGDEEGEKYFKELLDSSGCIGLDAIVAFDHYKTKKLKTSFGTLICRYKLSKRCRSELMYREARELKYLQKFEDRELNDSMYVITENTLDWIEEQGLDCIQARVMLDCHCKHGVCAHCYGLRLSNLRIARVGENVGTESAQSIGEPAAQLTMDVINKGGVSGASIASGIDIFSAYLNGSVYGGKDARVADVPKRSGYARVTKIDDTVELSVEPEDKSCTMCRICQQENDGICPLRQSERVSDPLCSVPVRTPLNMLLVKNGEWVPSGNAITAYPAISDTITTVDDSDDPEIVLRHKQMVWVDNYFNIFHSQSVDINAKHFELLAMVQNQTAIVTDSINADYTIGQKYRVSELRDVPGVKYVTHTTNLNETILRNSGLLTALTFSGQPRLAQKAAFCHISNSLDEVSAIGAISFGQNLATGMMKDLHNTKITNLSAMYDNAPVKQEDKMEELFPIDSEGLGDLSGSSLFDELNDMDAFDAFAEDDLFDDISLEPPKADKPEVAEERLHYTVCYVLDGIEDSSLQDDLEGVRGDKIYPEMAKIPDSYELVPSGDDILSEDFEVFTFNFVSIESSDIVTEEVEIEEEEEEETEETTDGLIDMDVFG